MAGLSLNVSTGVATMGKMVYTKCGQFTVIDGPSPSWRSTRTA